MVAWGFTQKARIDFTETFAPVVHFNTFRVLLAITAMEDLELDQVDFKSVYLKWEIEEEVYIELPNGHKQGNKIGRLNRAIYGTRQGGNCWHAKLDQAFHHPYRGEQGLRCLILVNMRIEVSYKWQLRN